MRKSSFYLNFNMNELNIINLKIEFLPILKIRIHKSSSDSQPLDWKGIEGI